MRGNWTQVVIRDVADLVRGVTYAKNDSRDTPAEGFSPILRATNIQHSRLVLESDLVFVPSDNVSPTQRLRTGDIVMATSSGSKHLVGKSALMRTDWAGSFGAFCATLRAKPTIDPRYLSAFLQSPAYWQQVTKKALGVNINNLRRGDIETLALPLPELDEQREIVAELEKQFSRLDEAVANLQRVKANLKRYKASVLKDAVEGRLVPTEAELARREGRSFETGEQLLRRILETRRKEWKGRGEYRAPISADVTKLPELPYGWSWSTLDQLTSKITSGSRDWSRYYGKGSGIFVLAQNVRPFKPDFSVQQFVDPPLSDPSCDRSRVQDDDLLATIVGANAGQICLVTKAPVAAYVCQSVALMRPVIRSSAAYLNYWLNSAENGQRYLEQCMYGQGRPHLSNP